MCTNHKTFFLCLLSLMFCNCGTKTNIIPNQRLEMGNYYSPSNFKDTTSFYINFSKDNFEIFKQKRGIKTNNSTFSINSYAEIIKKEKNDFLDKDLEKLWASVNEILNDYTNGDYEYRIQEAIFNFVKNIMPNDINTFFDDVLLKGALNKSKVDYTSVNLFYYLATSLSDFVFVTDKTIEKLKNIKYQLPYYNIDQYTDALIQQCCNLQDKIFDLYRTKINNLFYQMTGIDTDLELILKATKHAIKISLANRGDIYFPEGGMCKVLTRFFWDCKSYKDHNKSIHIKDIFDHKDVASKLKGDIGYNRLKKGISSALMKYWGFLDDATKQDFGCNYNQFKHKYTKDKTVKDLRDDLLNAGLLDKSKFPLSQEEEDDFRTLISTRTVVY